MTGQEMLRRDINTLIEELDLIYRELAKTPEPLRKIELRQQIERVGRDVTDLAARLDTL
jgi:hypothetical protein